MVDRTSRRSQIMTLKSGMQWLKVSVWCLFDLFETEIIIAKW